MFNRLTIGEVERVRLVLRGGTVIDWRRLNISTVDECNAILRANEFDPDNTCDAIRLAEIRCKAIDYLESKFGFKFADEVVNAPRTSDIMLLAAGRDPTLRPQACMVLKLMHVIHHVDACELRSKLAVSDRDLRRLVEEKTMRVARKMKYLGLPILEFKSSHKAQDSLITKLLSKKKTIRARVFEMIRFRIVVATVQDIVPVVAYLSQHIFPFNYTVPGESHNSIFDFPHFIKKQPGAKAMIPEFQVDLKFENEMRPMINADTSAAFRTVNFVVDLPIRIDDKCLQTWAPDVAVLPGIIHVLTEFQIVDQASHSGNERGEASHEKYEARRIAKVRKRLLTGMMTWQGKDSL